jgi:hypothetical protein
VCGKAVRIAVVLDWAREEAARAVGEGIAPAAAREVGVVAQAVAEVEGQAARVAVAVLAVEDQAAGPAEAQEAKAVPGAGEEAVDSADIRLLRH